LTAVDFLLLWGCEQHASKQCKQQPVFLLSVLADGHALAAAIEPFYRLIAAGCQTPAAFLFWQTAANLKTNYDHCAQTPDFA
jgi:hypothetical protein